MPGAQVAPDLLHHLRVINHRDHAQGFWQAGQRIGSACQTRRIRSRHRLEGSFTGGGGETPGWRTTSSAGRPRWRAPRILLLYIRGGGRRGKTSGSCRRRPADTHARSSRTEPGRDRAPGRHMRKSFRLTNPTFRLAPMELTRREVFTFRNTIYVCLLLA